MTEKATATLLAEEKNSDPSSPEDTSIDPALGLDEIQEPEMPETSPVPQEPPLPSLRSLLLSNTVAFILSFWVGLKPFLQGIHQNDSLFRGTTDTYPWPFYALGLATTIAFAIVGLYRLIRRGTDKARADRTYRLIPVGTTIFISLHLLFVVSIQTPQLPPSMVLSGIFASTALKPLQSDDGHFPVTPQFYADALAEMPPPYWREGERLTRWNVLVREQCTGPILELPGAVEPGTLLVCLSEDKTRAWMSAVGLSRDVVGVPALARFRQNILVAPLQIQQKPPTASPQSSGSSPPFPTDRVP